MRFKSVASALALVTAIGFGGAAYAQTTVNGIEVSAADLDRVTAYCEQLQSGMEPDATPSDSPESPTSTEAVGTEATPSETTDDSDESESSLELGDITLEGCIEAGLVEAAAQ